MLPLSLACIHPVINISPLKHYCRTIVPLPDPVLVEGLEGFETDCILDQYTGDWK